MIYRVPQRIKLLIVIVTAAEFALTFAALLVAMYDPGILEGEGSTFAALLICSLAVLNLLLLAVGLRMRKDIAAQRRTQDRGKE